MNKERKQKIEFLKLIKAGKAKYDPLAKHRIFGTDQIMRKFCEENNRPFPKTEKELNELIKEMEKKRGGFWFLPDIS